MKPRRTIRIGDLVQKTGGYGAECSWIGIVIDIKPACSDWGNKVMMLTVLTDDGFDEWIQSFCEVINENR